MSKSRSKRIVAGIALILVAVFLVLEQLNLISFQIGFWSLAWTAVFVISGIYSLMNKSISGTVFSIAFLLIIYAKPLHISVLSPWTILLVAVLVSVGLNMLFKRDFKPDVVINGKHVNADWSDLKNILSDEKKAQNSTTHDRVINQDDDEENTHGRTRVINQEDDENIVVSTHMGDVSRFIHSKNLRSLNVTTSLGDVKLYLEDSKAAGDTVYANLDANLGDVTFYIPSNWKVRSNVDATFGDINVESIPSGVEQNGPTLVLQGRIKMGDVTAKYVD